MYNTVRALCSLPAGSSTLDVGGPYIRVECSGMDSGCPMPMHEGYTLYIPLCVLMEIALAPQPDPEGAAQHAVVPAAQPLNRAELAQLRVLRHQGLA